MKHLLMLALLLYVGKNYYMQVFTETVKKQRIITKIIIHPKTKFTKAEQKELIKYINRKDAIINEHLILWRRED